MKILWWAVAWMPLLMMAISLNERKFHKNITLGVTVPPEHQKDQELLEIVSRFRVWTWILGLSFTALGLLGGFLPEVWAGNLWGLWMVASIVIVEIPYVRSNLRLKALKARRGWAIPQTGTVTVDTAAMTELRPMAWWSFLIPLILCFVPLLWKPKMGLYLLISAGTVVLFGGLSRIYRNKSERVDNDPGRTQTLTRVRRRNWDRIFLVASYAIAAMNLVLLGFRSPIAQAVGMIFCMGFLVLGCCYVDFQTRNLQERLTRDCGITTDEDDRWIWGMFYYNPQDSHTLVNMRVGTNSSFNLAKPAGKIIMGLCLLLVLAIPILIPALTQAPDLTLEGDTIYSAGYEIPISDITEAELLDELPDGTVRVAGTGMPTVLRGLFSDASGTRMHLNLNPQNPPFLRITTTTGTTYLLGDPTTAAQQIFEQLQK